MRASAAVRICRMSLVSWAANRALNMLRASSVAFKCTSSWIGVTDRKLFAKEGQMTIPLGQVWRQSHKNETCAKLDIQRLRHVAKCRRNAHSSIRC
jgi:hypothetical protein